jgi:hypothetical protein
LRLSTTKDIRINEHLYQFVDALSNCFDYLATYDNGDGYLKMLAHLFKNQATFSMHDIQDLKNTLFDLGLVCGIDFYVKKVKQQGCQTNSNRGKSVS